MATSYRLHPPNTNVSGLYEHLFSFQLGLVLVVVFYSPVGQLPDQKATGGIQIIHRVEVEGSPSWRSLAARCESEWPAPPIRFVLRRIDRRYSCLFGGGDTILPRPTTQFHVASWAFSDVGYHDLQEPRTGHPGKLGWCAGRGRQGKKFCRGYDEKRSPSERLALEYPHFVSTFSPGGNGSEEKEGRNGACEPGCQCLAFGTEPFDEEHVAHSARFEAML